MRDKKLTKWRKSWKSLTKPWGTRLEWDKVVWERKERAIEREIERNEGRITWRSINRPSVNLNRWGVETFVKEGVEKLVFDRYRYRGGVKEQPSDTKIEARSIHQLSRSYRGGRNFLDRSTRCQEANKIAIRKSLRSSTDSYVSRRCRGGVKLAFKSSFLKSEKHRHECKYTCNSTNNPNTILTSQNHLSIAILSTWIPKTHARTKQV